MKEIIHLETDPGEMLAACGVNRYDHDVMPDRQDVTCSKCLAPDEFPPAGTWSVNQTTIAGLYFITESHGDGTNTVVNIDPHKLDICLSSADFKSQMEQICLRHNEGIREEKG